MINCCLRLRKACKRFRNVFFTLNANAKKPATTCGRIFFDGTYENATAKRVVGFLVGIFLTITVAHTLMQEMFVGPVVALILLAVLGLGICVSLAASPAFRCILMVAAPSIFSGRGRDLIMIYVMVLAMNGPMRNFGQNVLVTVDTLNCAQSQVEEAAGAAAAPFKDAYRKARDIVSAAKEFVSDVKRQFLGLTETYRDIRDRLSRVGNWLQQKLSICDKGINELYKKCTGKYKKLFERLAGETPLLVNYFNGIRCIAFVMCEYTISEVCHYADSKHQKFCTLDDEIAGYVRKKVVDKAKERMQRLEDRLKDMFYFDADIDQYFSYELNKSRSDADVRDAIRGAIMRETEWIRGLLYYVNSLFIGFTFILLMHAAVYRRRYMTKDGFDNVYVTSFFRKIDEQRKKQGKEALLPLKRREKHRYIHPVSLRMVRAEKKDLALGILTLAAHAGHVGLYLAADYGLWWILDRILYYRQMVEQVPVQNPMTVEVEGNGPTATLYRRISGALNPSDDEAERSVGILGCIPSPLAPDLETYTRIGVLLLVSLWFLLLEAYALRSRHVICSWFYPGRERERAVFMYNEVLMQRGSFFSIAAREAVTRRDALKASQKISLLSRLMARVSCFRLVAKLFGYVRKYCMSCGHEGRPEDVTQFVHCNTYGCKGVYCNECHADLKNVCVLCSSSIAFTAELHDEEADSSSSESEVADSESDGPKGDEEKVALLLAHQQRAATEVQAPAKNDERNRNRSARPRRVDEVLRDRIRIRMLNTLDPLEPSPLCRRGCCVRSHRNPTVTSADTVTVDIFFEGIVDGSY